MGQIVKVYKDGIGYQVLNTDNIGAALEAGDNISIDGNEISAVDTKYAAGTGLSLSGTTFSLNVDYGADLSLSIDPSTFVLTAQLKNQNGGNIGSPQTIDLPLESVVVSGRYNAQTKEVELTLQSGSVIRFSVADLVSGLQEELVVGNGINIDANNEISVDTSVIATKEYVDDSIAESVSSGATAPSNPTEGQLWYDTTNDVLKVYDGTNWIEVGAGVVYTAGSGIDITNDEISVDNTIARANDVNTKTFYMSSYSDITTAQAAYDWYNAGKNPIIILDKTTYTCENQYHSTSIYWVLTGVSLYNSGSDVGVSLLAFHVNGSTILDTNIRGPYYMDGRYLSKTNTDAYTPTGDYNPATKKYVDDSIAESVYSGATAPSNPTEGQLWYDTTNNVLKVYDGTNWNETGATYTAGSGIDITNNVISADTTTLATKSDLDEKQDLLTAGNNITITCPTENDMKGPSPSGFHIPDNSEFRGIYGVLTSTLGLAADGATLRDYLKMPYAGYRSYLNNGRVISDYEGYYGTSQVFGSDGPYYFMFRNGYVRPDRMGGYFKDGYSIRCFKNTPVVPDNTWTTLYDGSSVATGAGVFHNATLGLISVSGDGTTWTTIMDKNLGATTVYNNGDTKSEANCGGFFQFGNNYMFPYSGDITVTSTQVDSTGYGPGNYYYSSNFIICSESDWSSVSNNNRRGYVTHGTFQDCEHPIIEAAGGVTYTAGDNINITNNVISAENVIKIDSVNNAGFRIEDGGSYIDANYGMIDIGYENNASGYQSNNTVLMPGEGISSEIYNEGPGGNTYEHSQVQLTNTFISATFDYNNGGGDAGTLQEDYAFFGAPVGTDENKIAKLGDIKNVMSSGTTAPSNPTEGQLWYDTTNDALKVYDGTSWNIVGDDSANINTKTFTLTGTTGESNLETAQAAYNWYAAGKTPLLKFNYDSGGNFYIPTMFSSTGLNFVKPTLETSYQSGGRSYIDKGGVTLVVNVGGQVTSIDVRPTGGGRTIGRYLDTEVNYSTPYTPQYDGSPATKKYVDDSVASSKSSGATAPSNPTEGQLWYDTANDVLKVYDGTNWNEVGGGGGEGNVKFFANTTAGLQEMHDWLYNSTGRYGIVQFSSYKHFIFGPTTTTNGRVYNVEGYKTTGLSFNNGSLVRDRQNVYYNISNGVITGGLGGVSSGSMIASGIATQSYVDARITSSSTAPSNPTEGQLWYDTTNDVLKVYDGTNWNTVNTDTTYNAGTGLTLNGTTFSADTTVLATKQDIADLGSFEVVALLPSVGSANTKTIYLLGPIGTGADKYEEWIVTEDSQQQKQWTKIGETSMDLSGYATTSDLTTGLAAKQDTLTASTGINIDSSNNISNTGVLSVNGNTGNVTIADIYSDYAWVAKSGTNIELSINSTLTPTANFTINAPAEIKDGQIYILRVTSGGALYNMNLGTNITNPFATDLTLTRNGIDQFVFMAIGGNLELQPEAS